MTPARFAVYMRAAGVTVLALLLVGVVLGLTVVPWIVYAVDPTSGHLSFAVGFGSVWAGIGLIALLIWFYFYIDYHKQWPWRAAPEQWSSLLRWVREG